MKGVNKYPAPKGLELVCVYTANMPHLQGIEMQVHYAIYQGLPLIEKWVTLQNNSNKPLHINRVVHEILGLVRRVS